MLWISKVVVCKFRHYMINGYGDDHGGGFHNENNQNMDAIRLGRKTKKICSLLFVFPEQYDSDTPEDFKRVFYYQGHTPDKTDSSLEEKSTFLCFYDKALAKRVCNSSRRVNDSPVLRADFWNVRRYLVCFPRFENFLAENKYLLLKGGYQSYSGHPSKETADSIIELTNGIAVAHQCEVTSTHFFCCMFERVYLGLISGKTVGLKLKTLLDLLSNEYYNTRRNLSTGYRLGELYKAAMINNYNGRRVWSADPVTQPGLFAIFIYNGSKYNCETVTDLLRFLKNVYSHYAEKQKDQQGN